MMRQRPASRELCRAGQQLQVPSSADTDGGGTHASDSRQLVGKVTLEHACKQNGAEGNTSAESSGA